MCRHPPVPRLATNSPSQAPSHLSAQAAPDAENILLCLAARLFLGAGALGGFLKSNYAYYRLGFQKPALFAECMNSQPFPSLMLPDSPILQVEKCANTVPWRKAATESQRWKEKVLRTLLVSMELPSLHP